MTTRALTAPRSKPYSARRAEKSPIIEQLANSRPVDERVRCMNIIPTKSSSRKPYLTLPKDRGYWHVRYNGKLKSTGTRDRGEAHEFLENFRKELEAPSRGASATLSDILDGWEQDRQIANPLTWERKWKYVSRRLRQYGGWKSLAEIDTEWLADYAWDRCDRGASEPTVRQDVTSLLAAWKLGLKARPPITRLPVPTVKLPRASEPSPFFLTQAEAERLIGAADKEHVRLFIRLGLATGGRHLAILQLTWSRVDLETGYIDLRLRDPIESARARKARQRKEGRQAGENRPSEMPRMKGRGYVKAEGAVLDALREARERAVTDHVIEWAGAPIKSIATAFRSAVLAADLDPDEITPHALRHTAITWLMQAGEDINQIASFAGHSSPDMIRRVYGHHHPSFQATISRALAQRV